MSLPTFHPLYGAHLRVKRAGYLIGTLRKQLQRWTADQMAEGNMQYRQIEPFVFEAFQTNPPIHHLYRAAVTAGEIAYNCRASLDYLVAELAKGSNRGKPVTGTQFPIETEEAMFNARVTGVHPNDPEKSVGQYLRKVPPEAVEIFRQLQPFAGCEWTALLRDISNRDKHRFVPSLRSKEDFDIATFDPEAKTISGRLIVNVVFEHHGEIDVVSGLRWIQQETANLIRGFAPAFVLLQESPENEVV